MTNGLQRLFDRFADPQPGVNTFVSAFGRKKSGKSTLNRICYQASPLPKLCIDVNGDAQPGPDAQRIFEVDRKMPISRDPEDPPADLHYIANPASDTYKEDLDRAVGMALFPKDVEKLVWIGEVGEFSTQSHTPPHMRLLVQQSRHYNTSVLFDGPRPMKIEPLILSQSDFVVIFRLPNQRDRDRIAEEIGYDTKEFSAYCKEVWARGEHHFLLFELNPPAGEDQLIACEPLPLG